MRRLDLRQVLGEVDAEQLEAEHAEHLDRALKYAEFLGEVLRGSPGWWAEQAACRGYTRTMFPEHGQSAEPAYTLCEVCTVQEQCRQWADDAGNAQGGILAGESERNRRSRHVEERRAA